MGVASRQARVGATNSIPATLSLSGSLTNALAAPQPGSVAESLGRMMGALALLFAVLFGALWVYRRWQHLLQQRAPISGLRVVEAKNLGQRSAVCVVGYRHQRFLIGVSRAGLSLLSPLEPEPVVSQPGSPEGGSDPGLDAGRGTSFQRILEKARNPSA